MNIPKQLPQFNNEKSLIISSARQDARFFTAHNGKMGEIDEFKIERPKYSDHEGFFGLINKSKHLFSPRAGVGFGHLDEKMVQDFNKEFIRIIKSIVQKNGIASLYLISSESIIKNANRDIPRPLREKIKMEIIGNYFNLNPLKILEKIREEINRKIGAKKIILATPEALKILSR